MADRKQTLVDINKASMDELISIRGIGAGLAARIIEKRPYADLHDLIEVSGINETKLAALLPFITLGTKDRTKPVAEKSSTAEPKAKKPVSTLGGTEAFVFLEDSNERQDALLIVLGGFILGLLILMLRRRK